MVRQRANEEEKDLQEIVRSSQSQEIRGGLLS